MRRIQFEVLPEIDGGRSVTRDSVVTGTFGLKPPAIEYAVDAANRSGSRASISRACCDSGTWRMSPETLNAVVRDRSIG
jgi:hypothetical protein